MIQGPRRNGCKEMRWKKRRGVCRLIGEMHFIKSAVQDSYEERIKETEGKVRLSVREKGEEEKGVGMTSTQGMN